MTTKNIAREIARKSYCNPSKAAKLLPDLWAARLQESWSYASRSDRSRWAKKGRRG